MNNHITIKNTKAFTLIEMMIVVAIISVLSGIAIPTYISNIPTYRLKKSSSELSANLKKARSMAIKMNRPVTVSFDASTKKYFLDQRALAIESRTSFGSCSGVTAIGGGSPPSDGISFADNKITFNSRGFPDVIGENAVYIRNEKNETHMVVVTAAGNIRRRIWGGGSWN